MKKTTLFSIFLCLMYLVLSCNTKPPEPPVNTDSDNDGIFDSADQCPNTPSGESVNNQGCSDSQLGDDDDDINDSDSLIVFDDAVASIWDQGIQAFSADLNYTSNCTNGGSNCPSIGWEVKAAENSSRGQVIEVIYNDNSQFSGLFISNETPYDLTAYVNGVIVFDINVVNKGSADGTFDIQLDCGAGCSSARYQLRANEGYRADSSGWQTVSVAISRLINGSGGGFVPQNRLDASRMNMITTGIVIFPTENQQLGVVFQLDNIRWKKDNNVGEDMDSDNDGVNDSVDECSNTPSGASVNSQGCATSQLDSDNDMVTDDVDECANTSSSESVNNVGCSVNQLTVKDGDSLIVFDDAVASIWNQGIQAFSADLNYNSNCTDGGSNCPSIGWEVKAAGNSSRGQVIEVSYANNSQFSGLFIFNDAPYDLTAYVNGAIVFDINVVNKGSADGTFDIQLDCDVGCSSGRYQLQASEGYRADSSGWQTVSVAISRLIDSSGTGYKPTNVLDASDMDMITTGIVIFPTEGQQSGVVFQLDNIRWKKDNNVGEDMDSDNDGVNDSVDECSNTPSGASVNSQGCATSQLDSDNDMVTDDVDECANTSSSESVNNVGCSVNQLTVKDGDSLVVFDDAVASIWNQGIQAFSADLNYGPNCTNGGSNCPSIGWEVKSAQDSSRGQIIEISYDTASQFSGTFIFNDAPYDLTAYVNGAIVFDINVVNKGSADGTFDIQLDCGAACGSGRYQLQVSEGYSANSSGWQTVSVAISRLIDGEGRDYRPPNVLNASRMNMITTGIVIFPTDGQQSGVVFQLDNIRWKK